jgi:uncharacterized protein YjbJ (UPF0337 family)
VDSNQLKGSWNQTKGLIKEKWGELTDDDLQEIEGKKDRLIGKLQSKYGYAKEKAEKLADDFEKSLNE